MRKMKNGFSKHSTWQDKYYDGEISSNEGFDEDTQEYVTLSDYWETDQDSERYIEDHNDSLSDYLHKGY